MTETVKPLETLEDYEKATREIQELSGAPSDCPEEERLKALVAAVEKWDLDHDDATRWK